MSSNSAAKWMEPADSHAGEVRKLSTLLEASQALTGTLDLRASLQRVLEILGDHHGAIRSTVVLLNDQTGDVQVEASAGAIQPGKRVRYRLGEGITGRVVETGSRSSCRASVASRCSCTVPPSGPIAAAGTELRLGADHARRQDRGCNRNRPAVQSRPRLPPDGEVSWRRRVDDCPGRQGPPTDRGRPAAAGRREHPSAAGVEGALRFLESLSAPAVRCARYTNRSLRSRGPTPPC